MAMASRTEASLHQPSFIPHSIPVSLIRVNQHQNEARLSTPAKYLASVHTPIRISRQPILNWV